MRKITHPLWGNGRPSYCGLDCFELGCQDDEYAFMDFSGRRYTVLEINQTNRVMSMGRNDLWNGPCLQDRSLNMAINNILFYYPAGVKNVSIFYCPSPIPNLNLSTVLGENPCPDRTALLVKEEFTGHLHEECPDLNRCNITKVPVFQCAIDELRAG